MQSNRFPLENMYFDFSQKFILFEKIFLNELIY